MSTSVLTLPLRSKRDILLARQRARQIARLAGFDRNAQLRIAAAAFEIAWSAFKDPGRSAVLFRIDEGMLQVLAAGVPRRTQSPAAVRSNRQPQGTPGKLDSRGAQRLLGRLASVSASSAKAGLCFEALLPKNALAMSPEDMVWAIYELARHSALNLFEEIHQQNQEMLRLLEQSTSVTGEVPPQRDNICAA